MTNPASRARQIAASNLFFQAQAHASAHASIEVSPFWGTRLAYKAPRPRKRRSRQRPGSLRSGALLCCSSSPPRALPPLLSCTLEPCRISASVPCLPGAPAVHSTAHSTPASGLQSAAQSAPASGLQSAAWSTPASDLQSMAQSTPASGLQSAAQSAPASGLQSVA